MFCEKRSIFSAENYKNSDFLNLFCRERREKQVRQDLREIELTGWEGQCKKDIQRDDGAAWKAGDTDFTDFYRSLEGSFSAGSTATIATKYSFFSGLSRSSKLSG